jgi:hypothetical protein
MNLSETLIYQALKAQYEAQKLKALANIKILVENPVGVAEHPDTISTLTSQVEDLAHADEVIGCLEKYFEQNKEKETGKE